MFKSALFASALAVLATPALASAFWAGTVIHVSPDDVLNLRKWPAANSQVIATYDNGDTVSLTGRCKNTSTNISFRIDGPQSKSWKYDRMRQANVWCQAMSEYGDLGWLRGKYLWP